MGDKVKGKNCLNARKNAINQYGVITVVSMRSERGEKVGNKTGKGREDKEWKRGRVETVTKGSAIVLESQLGLRHALYSIKPKCTARDPFSIPFSTSC